MQTSSDLGLRWYISGIDLATMVYNTYRFSYLIFLMNPGEYIILMFSVPRLVMSVRIWFFLFTLHSRNPDELSLSFVWCIVYSLHEERRTGQISLTV